MSHRTTPSRELHWLSWVGLVAVVVLVAVVINSAMQADSHRTQFTSVVIRGGGYVTGLTVEGDMMYARTDVGGAYRFDVASESWQQMINTRSVTEDRRASDYQVEALGAAPSNPSVVYMLVGSTSGQSPGARVMRSQDAGHSWIVQSTNWYVGGNDEWRQSGARIAVDPTDPDVLFVGTRRDGLQLSQDGGRSWETMFAPTDLDHDLGVYSIGVTSVVIDAASPVQSGRHSVVWAGVAGVGLARSVDGGRSWTVMSAFSTGFVSDMSIASNGVVVASFYGLGEDDSSYVRRVGPQGRVDDVTPPFKARWLTVATDPVHPDTVIVAADRVVYGDGMFVSRDATSPQPKWAALPVSIAAGSDGTTWPVKSDVFSYLSTGQIRYFGGQVWFGEGVGMWRSGADFGDSVTWNFASDGVEEFVGNAILRPKGASLLTAEWDRGLMRHPDPTNAAPTDSHAAGFPFTSQFGSAWDLAVSPSDAKFVVSVLDDHQDLSGRVAPQRRSSGYSTDGGVTWTRFTALTNRTAPPDLMFGNIAVSASDNGNLVWVPSNLSGLETKIYYSRDSGVTWSSGRMNGLAPGQYLHDKYTQARKILVADPVSPHVFYALGSNDAGAGILWKSTDGGANWDISWQSQPAEVGSSGFRYDSTLAAVDGHLIAVPGRGGGCFFRSMDSTQWQRLCNIKNAMGLGVGAPLEGPGGSATIYTYGDVNGAEGIYRSTDYGGRWERVSGIPSGLYMGIRAIAGDPDVGGRLYVALGGGGFLVGQSAS